MRVFAAADFGEVGSVSELPVPEPGPGEVRVRVHAAGLNPMDVFVLSGTGRSFGMKYEFPIVAGLDVSGVVDAVGPGVELHPGDEVFGIVQRPVWGRGSLAEYVIAHPASLARKPAAIDHVTAAALSTAGRTALVVVDVVEPHPGQKVLVVGATGGVGSFTTQLLAGRGAHVIASIRPENAEYARTLGAAELIDYTAADLATQVRAAHPDGIDGLVDFANDEAHLTALASVVRSGGVVVSPLRAANDEILSELGLRAVNIAAAGVERQAELAEMLVSGRLRPPHIRVLPLDRAGEGLAEQAGRHVRGKLVVTPG